MTPPLPAARFRRIPAPIHIDRGEAAHSNRFAPSLMPPDPQTVVEHDEPGRINRTVAWGKATTRRLGDRAVRERKHHTSVDVGFRTFERQRRVAAMVLAGGIAYRIFFWLLALSVVFAGVLGFFDPSAVQNALEHQGVAAWA